MSSHNAKTKEQKMTTKGNFSFSALFFSFSKKQQHILTTQSNDVTSFVVMIPLSSFAPLSIYDEEEGVGWVKKILIWIQKTRFHNVQASNDWLFTTVEDYKKKSKPIKN